MKELEDLNEALEEDINAGGVERQNQEDIIDDTKNHHSMGHKGSIYKSPGALTAAQRTTLSRELIFAPNKNNKK